MVKLLLFGLPLSLFSGWNLYQTSTDIAFKQGVILTSLPTLFLFQKCFWATTQLITEFRDLFDVFNKIFLLVKKIFLGFPNCIEL